MLNTCAVNWQGFSNRWAMKIALGGHEIPSPEFITGDCAILSTDKSAVVFLLAPYIAIVCLSFNSFEYTVSVMVREDPAL